MKAYFKTRLYVGEEYHCMHINLEVEETEDSFIITFPEALTDRLKNQEMEVIILDGDVGEIDVPVEVSINKKGEMEVCDGQDFE